MQLLIAGGRDFDDYELLCSVVDRYRGEHRVKRIVSGGAGGADRLGERYAKRHHLPILRIKPEWDRHGRAAGILRNQDLVDAADHVICFWDEKSKGTQDTIKKTRRANKSLEIVVYSCKTK